MLTDLEWSALRLSLIVATCSVAVSLPLAIGVAWLLERVRFRGKALADTIVHLPMVLPPVVIGYLLLLGFGVHGPIGAFLDRELGIRFAFTRAGAILATAVMTFPLIVRAVRLAMSSIDRGLEDAARTLGAGPVDRFVSVTLPLMMPGILSGAIVAFSAGLGEFGAVVTLVANIPGQTQTLPLAIYAALQSPTGEQVAARLATISFTLAFAGLFLSELLRRRVQQRLGR